MIGLGTLMIVLAATTLHATWNAMVKGASDQTSSIGLVSLGYFVPALPFLLFLPIPDTAALPYIVASTVIN
tara:strand:+ start:847 stop:1059 length:213 start_codon:yes stop_codon:yes gene_type:complete